MSRNLVLSLFPGIDLFGMAFEQEGWCVVRGPDTLWGGDIRHFHPTASFAGIIAGSPCQDFSRLRRTPPTGYGLEMLGEFVRCVERARPEWFVLENVPGVPPVQVPHYTVQRIHIRASELAGTSHRLRVMQFGQRVTTRRVRPLVIPRVAGKAVATQPAALASDGRRSNRRGWAEFCAAQGLPQPLQLHNLTQAARYRVVGNGVHLAVGRAVAMAVRTWCDTSVAIDTCQCECGRPLHGGRKYAEAACRKRAQRKRDTLKGSKPSSDTCERDRAAVTGPGVVTAGTSPARLNPDGTVTLTFHVQD